jgi:hypothetical protein
MIPRDMTHDAPTVNAWEVDLAFELDKGRAVRVGVWAVDGQAVDSVLVDGLLEESKGQEGSASVRMTWACSSKEI